MRYCLAHKADFMVDLVNKKCAHEGCQGRASYGFVDDGVALYCSMHMKASMMDVVNEMCTVRGCKKQATHGSLSDKVCVYSFATVEL